MPTFFFYQNLDFVLGRSDTEQELLDRSDGESERRQPRDITNLVERRKYATKLFAQLMNVKQGKRPGDLLRDGVFRQQKDITMMAYIDGWRHMVDLCMSHGSLGYLRHLSEDRIKAMTQHYMSTFENTLLADQGEQRIPWYFTAKTVSDEEEVILGGNFGEPDPFPGVFDEDVRSSLARSSLESRVHCVLETCTSPKLHTRSQIGLESKSDVEAAELDILSHTSYSGGDSTSDSESEDTGASKGVPSLSPVDQRLGPVDPIEGLLSGQVRLNVHERQQPLVSRRVAIHRLCRPDQPHTRLTDLLAIQVVEDDVGDGRVGENSQSAEGTKVWRKIVLLRGPCGCPGPSLVEVLEQGGQAQ